MTELLEQWQSTEINQHLKWWPTAGTHVTTLDGLALPKDSLATLESKASALDNLGVQSFMMSRKSVSTTNYADKRIKPQVSTKYNELRG